MNNRSPDRFDLDELLHPAQAFDHPAEVANDPDLTLKEKRAILASWASDVCAVEAAPELRSAPRGDPVRFDDIMDALRQLDRDADQMQAPYKRLLKRRRYGGLFRRREDPDSGQPLQ